MSEFNCTEPDTRPKPSNLQLNNEALELKVPQEAILTESASRDTIGNAVNVANEILVPGNMRRVLLVTTPRAQKAFEWALGESFTVDVVAAPERFAAWKRAKAWGAFLTMHYILRRSSRRPRHHPAKVARRRAWLRRRHYAWVKTKKFFQPIHASAATLIIALSTSNPQLCDKNHNLNYCIAGV